MRTRNPLAVAAVLLATLMLSPSPAVAQGHGRGHGGPRVVVGVGVGSYYGPSYRGQWYPPFGYPPYYPRYRYPVSEATADVRLQVEPDTAEVYVDGYLAGNVNQFNGYFHKLSLKPGPHELVVYKDGFHSLTRRMYFAPYSSQNIKENLQHLAQGEPPDPRPIPAQEPQQEQPRGQYGRPPEGREQVPPPGRRPAPEPPPAGTPVIDAQLGRLTVRVQPQDADVVIDGELWQRPQGADRLVIILQAGPHRIDVRRAGFVPFGAEVVVKPGETVPLNVSLSERQ